MKTFSLYELNSMVASAIEEALPEQYWVEAELMEIREVKGHCYMQLVQKDLFSTTPVAQASAKCWKTQWMKVGQKFLNATGGYPQRGMQLLLKVNVDFHPTYGFSLIVSDIDPTYTIGDMARRRQEIIDQLKAEGVFDLQRELSLPLFVQRIAVISSATAAGYGDFCNQLENNDYGFRFHAELFPAIMQGEQVEKSIISQLDAINARMDDFDCVVIIRGGGAVADMSGFDSLPLAENIANFPLPVITGIGHERDECVLDLISFHKVKTPTAAAAFLIDALADVWTRIEDAQNTIVASVALTLERQKTHLSQLSTSIIGNARIFHTREDSRLERMLLGITTAIQQRFLKENHRLEMLSQRINSLDPKLLLKRGYTMTLIDGKVIKDASQLHSGQEIDTIFEKGTIKSIVK